jgi:hypothetical protein
VTVTVTVTVRFQVFLPHIVFSQLSDLNLKLRLRHHDRRS